MDSFCREEASGCDRDALVMNRGGTFLGRFRGVGLLGRYCCHSCFEGRIAGRQIGNGVVERVRRALHCSGSVDRFSGLSGGFGCQRIGRSGCVTSFVDLTIALGEFFLQQSKLLLLGLQDLTELLNLGSDRRVRLVRLRGGLGFGRRRRLGRLRVRVLRRVLRCISECGSNGKEQR